MELSWGPPKSVAVGMPVTISGSNFGSTQGTSTVTFSHSCSRDERESDRYEHCDHSPDWSDDRELVSDRPRRDQQRHELHG